MPLAYHIGGEGRRKQEEEGEGNAFLHQRLQTFQLLMTNLLLHMAGFPPFPGNGDDTKHSHRPAGRCAVCVNTLCTLLASIMIALGSTQTGLQPDDLSVKPCRCREPSSSGALFRLSAQQSTLYFLFQICRTHEHEGSVVRMLGVNTWLELAS